MFPPVLENLYVLVADHDARAVADEYALCLTAARFVTDKDACDEIYNILNEAFDRAVAHQDAGFRVLTGNRSVADEDSCICEASSIVLQVLSILLLKPKPLSGTQPIKVRR